mgnify:CR=1 FL=1
MPHRGGVDRESRGALALAEHRTGRGYWFPSRASWPRLVDVLPVGRCGGGRPRLQRNWLCPNRAGWSGDSVVAHHSANSVLH